MRVHEITVPKDLQAHDLQAVAQQAGRFRSDITLKLEEERVVLDAKSMLGMMLLPIRGGTRVLIQTKGSDEEEALDAMCELLERLPLTS